MGNGCFKAEEDELEIPDYEDGIVLKPRESVESLKNEVSEFDKINQKLRLDNLQKMREDLKNNPNIFILNNLILCISFFENFEKYELFKLKLC